MEKSINVGLLSTEEATLKRILAHPNVEGLILANEQGQPQFTSFDNNITFPIASKLLSFAALARLTIRDIDPTDNLLTLRLRTREKEMMVVTPQDGMQAIAIQKVTSSLATIPQTDEEYPDS